MQFLGRCSRNWIGMFAIIFAVVVLSAPAMAQPVDPFPPEVWHNVYDGTYGHDLGYGVAIDSQKNVIVAGYRRTSNSATSYLDSYAVKYNYSGNFVCEMAVSGPVGTNNVSDAFYGVAVDSQDNLIISGTIGGTYDPDSLYPYLNAMYLNKYNPACSPVWTNPVVYYAGSGMDQGAWQEAHSVAVDVNDNIYPSGRIFDWGTQGDWATWKYNSDGVLQSGFPIRNSWSNSLNYQDISYDVAVDSLGNMIVVGVRGVSDCSGTSCIINNLDWHVRKYNSSRTLLWEHTYSGAANLYDFAYRVAIDSENNIIVAGYTNKGTDNSTNANYDWLVIKYAADGVSGAGQRLWTYTYESEDSMSEAAQAIAVDENDNVIVGGYVQDTGGNLSGRLALLDKTTGDTLGERMITDPARVIPQRLSYQYATLAIGGYIWDPAGTNNNMYSALLAWDVTPDAFSFTDQTDVALSAVIESNVIAVTGIEYPSPISVTGGEYAINGGTYTSVAGTVSNGDTVRVRQTSSAAYVTTTVATVTIGGVSDTFNVTTVPALAPLSPSNGTTFDTCSYFSPPAFGWARNQSFGKLELQFYTSANATKPTKVKLKDSTSTSFQMTDKVWKKILKLPGLSGGVLNWKLVGTNKGQPIVETNVFTMTIAAPEPAGKPDISPVSQASLPTLTWGNSCATKFKVYFGPDRPDGKMKKLSFTDNDPTDNGGIFSVTLTDKTWSAIRKLVNYETGSPMFFYVESWDVLKRYQITDDVYFTLEP
jgi:hypothetical protein